MATPPPGPPQTAAPVPVAGPAPPPPTDQTGVCFRNPWFLNAVGGFLSPVNVFDYFAGSPFYDPSCSNEQLRMRGVHPLDTSQLKTMIGWEYALHEAKEPLLFVLKRQKRDGPEKVTVSTLFYVLDGSVYQAPTAHAIITSRMSRSLFNLHKAFNGFQTLLKDKKASKREAPDPTPAATAPQPDAAQISRMDIIIRSAMQRLPPPPAHILLQTPPAPAPAAAAAATGAGAGTGAQPVGGAGAAPGTPGTGVPGGAPGGVPGGVPGGGPGVAPGGVAGGVPGRGGAVAGARGPSGGAQSVAQGALGSQGEGGAGLAPLQRSNSRGSKGQAAGGPTKRQKRGG